ncbi:anthranilate phosphoribosyltransferase [Halobium palmae]|uniref:Anthranilate phosphoribosyltransferase n=1 Tax=Halobium palmae TaxID=1776492 RepID=A0ABD5RU56_9EURY
MDEIVQHTARICEGADLDDERARKVTHLLFEEATETQIGALLTALRTKGETRAEIVGFARGMRDIMRTIDPDCNPLVDICGTGGDDYDTINISTTSAIVAAGAGVAVAKHGNHSVSSSSGSADVLQAAGVDINAEPREVEAAIEADGIGFLLAPTFNPAMKRVINPRQEIGVGTVFNILGPLTNPAGAEAQVVGVYDPDLVPVVADVLARLAVDHALVVHGSGLDEIAVHDETIVAEVSGSHIDRYRIEPRDLGIEAHDIESLAGGTPEENAASLERIVTGAEAGANQDVILANAGAAIYVAGLAKSLKGGVAQARTAINSGAAASKLDSLRAD